MSSTKEELEISLSEAGSTFYLIDLPMGDDPSLVDLLNSYWSDEQLNQLREIQINDSDIKKVPQFISRARNLTGLYLGYNNISEVRLDQILSKDLLNFDLSENPLTTFEIDPIILTELQVLTLPESRLTVFPQSIAKLKKIKRLELQRGRIEDVQFEHGSLELLQELNLSFNRIGDLDNSNIETLKSIEILDLSSNSLLGIPEELGKLGRLDHLIIDSNQIESLPNSLGNLKRLSYLKAESNLISELPDSIFGCESLSALLFQNNLISFLPTTISKMTWLESVYFESNQFKKIPDELNLPRILRMDFAKNPIDSIPAWTYTKVDLELYLNECPINLKHIEESLVDVKKAKNVTLYLSGCPVESQKDQLPEIPGLTFSFEPMN